MQLTIKISKRRQAAMMLTCVKYLGKVLIFFREDCFQDTPEFLEQLKKVYRWTNICTQHIAMQETYPENCFVLKKADYDLKRFLERTLKEISKKDCSRAITYLEVCDLMLCDINSLCHDLKTREWRWLGQSLRKLMDKLLFPWFPECEEEGMDIYCNTYKRYFQGME